MLYYSKAMERDLILVGAGGHALSLAEFAGDKITGYLANNANPEMPGEWFGTDADLLKFIEAGSLFHIAFVYGRMPRMVTRRQLLDKYEMAGAKFATLISPQAIVTPNSEIGEGSAIMTGAIINRAKIGRHVIVNSGAIVEHDCHIGDNTFIGPGAIIGGFTTIGKNCFIGLGAKIRNGITIRDGATVGMGAIVTQSIL